MCVLVMLLRWQYISNTEKNRVYGTLARTSKQSGANSIFVRLVRAAAFPTDMLLLYISLYPQCRLFLLYRQHRSNMMWHFGANSSKRCKMAAVEMHRSVLANSRFNSTRNCCLYLNFRHHTQRVLQGLFASIRFVQHTHTLRDTRKRGWSMHTWPMLNTLVPITLTLMLLMYFVSGNALTF